MKRLICSLFCLLLALPALAGKTQVSQGDYRATTTSPYAGRSDGLYVTKPGSHALYAIENGTSAAIVNGPAFYEDFSKFGLSKGLKCLDNDYSTCVGDTTTTKSTLYFQDGFRLASYPIGTSTIVPIMTAAGLDITGDLAANEGWVVVGGGWAGSSGRPFFVGTDPAFYTCADIWSPDVSGNALLQVGFKGMEENTATLTSVTDYAMIGLVAGDVYIKTGLGGSDTSTDTTDNVADSTTVANGTHKYCVYVSALGVVTYTLDGSAPTTTAALTLTSGLPMQPVVWFVMDAGTDYGETTTIVKWDTGYQE